jgi:diguanylate cyclase (GGDEF)-like protein
MSEALGRRVGIAVAALDYLSNIRDEMREPILISQERMVTVSEIALKDATTGLYDRLTFNTNLNEELNRFKRYGNELSLIMLDIDFFKKFNDTHGHMRGDKVLSELGDIIGHEVRETDIAARYGGEEFAIILPQTGIGEAYALAERVRKHVAEQFKCDFQITISLGVAACPGDAKDGAGLVKAADKALYFSKNNGRNRTSTAEEVT